MPSLLPILATKERQSAKSARQTMMTTLLAMATCDQTRRMILDFFFQNGEVHRPPSIHTTNLLNYSPKIYKEYCLTRSHLLGDKRKTYELNEGVSSIHNQDRVP
jgi:hypothetical protein